MLTLHYLTIRNTITVLSELNQEVLVDKLLDIIANNELPKPVMHNKKSDITTSYFTVDLNEEETEQIIEILQDEQVKFIGEGEDYEQKYYHFSDLLDDWIE